MPILQRDPDTGRATTTEKKSVNPRLTKKEYELILFIRDQETDIKALIKKFKSSQDKEEKTPPYQNQKDPIHKLILDSLKNTPQNIEDFTFEFSRKNNLPTPLITKKIAWLFCDGKIQIDKTAPNELIGLICKIIDSEDQSFPIGIPFEKTKNLVEELHLSNNGEQYLKKIAEEHSHYFTIATAERRKGANHFIIQRLWHINARMWRNGY